MSFLSPRFARLFPAVAICLLLLSAPSPAVAQDPEPLLIPKHLYMQSVRFAIEQMEREGLSADHLVLADKEMFLTAVDGWLEGVAQDPGYLRHLDVLPWFASWWKAQQLTMEGFTQPKGWTGVAQSLPTPQEIGYNGFIVLADFQPQDPVTPFHEAIHAFTFAIDGGDIDLDAYGGPEFLSKGYRDLLRRAEEYDQRFCSIVQAYADGDDPAADVDLLTRGIDVVERLYDNAFEAKQVEELLEAMGGKADWEGYRMAVQEGIAAASAAATAGEPYEHPACRPATEGPIAGTVYEAEIDPAQLLSRPAAEHRTSLTLTVGDDGRAALALDIFIRTRYEMRTGCMRAGGSETGIALAADGSFSTSLPLIAGSRDVNVNAGENPCETMSIPDEPYPLQVTGTVDADGGLARVTLHWITGPLELELRRR